MPGPGLGAPGRRGEERKPDSCRGDSAKPARSAIHSLSHPSVRSTNPCRGPVGAGVSRGVEEGRRAGGSGRERCPRPAGDLSRRDPGGRRALGCGRGARRVPSLRGAGREAGVGFALGRRRGGPSRHVCSARDSGGVSPTLPRRRASWRAGGCSVWSLRPRPGGGGAGRVEWPRQRPACAVWLQAADGRNGASGAGEGGSMPGGGRAPRPEPHPPGGAVSPRGVGVRVLRSRNRRDGRAESP